jgi:DNA adenine methylase
LFSRERFEELAEALGALKGRFILSLNDVQGVRETFSAFRFQEVKTTYSVGAKGAQPERAEVLISNWQLGK